MILYLIYKGLKLIGEDGTRFLIKASHLKALTERGVKLFAENPINLIAVTVNPKSPDGFIVNSKSLCNQLNARLNLCILDIKSPNN